MYIMHLKIAVKLAGFKTASSRKRLAKDLAFIFLISLPVIVYVWKFAVANRHGIFIGEDWDEFAQAYEAARISILHYHQFPWWNPWSVGGEPLFANPQMGIFSIQMLLVLLFGTVVGLHLAVLAYFVAGFWGMYMLLGRLNASSKVLRVLLAYLWVFSGFPAWHLSGGHLTFAVYLLAPWIFFTLLNIRQKNGWIWFGMIVSVAINAAPHYMTIQALLIAGTLALFQAVRYLKLHHTRTRQEWWTFLQPYIYTAMLILLLSGVKLLYTFQFLHEFPRLDALDDSTVPFSLFIAAITMRQAINPQALFAVKWSWAEYADYFGLVTLLLAVYIWVKNLLKPKTVPYRDWFLMFGVALCVLFYLGSFASYAPYAILHHLPIFNQMRVPSRYIAWFTFGVIVMLRALPRRKIIYVLLVLSIVDVWSANYGLMAYSQKAYTPPTASETSKQFEQYAYFDTHGVKDLMRLSSFRLLRATQSNYGEVYGYEPVLGIGEYYVPTTIRCGINQGCPFVMSHNAIVAYWSPHKIILKRTARGSIELSMNPGKVWRVNGQDIFAKYRILETSRPFIITDPSTNIVVSFTPAL